eukprot:1045799-Prymnesium_polylepis.1
MGEARVEQAHRRHLAGEHLLLDSGHQAGRVDALGLGLRRRAERTERRIGLALVFVVKAQRNVEWVLARITRLKQEQRDGHVLHRHHVIPLHLRCGWHTGKGPALAVAGAHHARRPIDARRLAVGHTLQLEPVLGRLAAVCRQ